MYALDTRCFIKFSLASGFNKEYPLLEIITGSTTKYLTSYLFKV